MSLNSQSARVIDPVLTSVAQGYILPQRIGHVLFPAIPVLASGGKVIEFRRESFVNYKSRRAPGASVQRIQFGYEGKPFTLLNFAQDAPVPSEFVRVTKTLPGDDLGKRAVNTTMNSLNLTFEIEQAELATDPAHFRAINKLFLASQTQCDDPASDRIEDVEAATDQVRTACGTEHNHMAICSKGFKALKHCPKITERFKYTTSEGITPAMQARLFDLVQLGVGLSVWKRAWRMTSPSVRWT
ncbi:hypothetical protein [Shimia abyssi]|uniref:Uncharacterized protein n=1 Tax=Shimia abyssi TaxID=1662395 RepID=A0A2P8FJS0_9RHOB|nr:hypothetical protein [Shimia abyssi]PSL21965.1 hypothetical protein CLV88_101390 [Shimia abyssi]